MRSRRPRRPRPAHRADEPGFVPGCCGVRGGPARARVTVGHLDIRDVSGWALEADVPVSVVQDGPWWNPLTPVLRSSATVGGALLRVMARVALLLGVPIGCYWAFATFGVEQSLSSDLGGYPSGPLALVLALFGVTAELLGRRLVRRRRRTVLFLRRFGYDAATRAILAATESVGRTWRVVTLDDASVEPVEAAPYLRRSLAGVIRSAALAGRVAGIARTGFGRLYTLAFFVAVGLLLISDATGEEMLGRLETVVLWAVSFIETWWVRAVRVLAAAAALWVLAWLVMRVVRSGSRSLDAAMEHRYLQVSRASDIDEACQVLDSRERAVFNPRLMVVRVDSSVWQATVARLADACDVMLFDVSQPSDNLVWELDTLLAKYADSCVFIGELGTLRRHLDRVVAHTYSDGLDVEGRTTSPDTPVVRVDRLLEGRTVVGYCADPAGLRRFRRALRAELEKFPSRPNLPRQAPGRHSLRTSPGR